jgi:hypothetical protein
MELEMDLNPSINQAALTWQSQSFGDDVYIFVQPICGNIGGRLIYHLILCGFFTLTIPLHPVKKNKHLSKLCGM